MPARALSLRVRRRVRRSRRRRKSSAARKSPAKQTALQREPPNPGARLPLPPKLLIVTLRMKRLLQAREALRPRLLPAKQTAKSGPALSLRASFRHHARRIAALPPAHLHNPSAEGIRPWPPFQANRRRLRSALIHFTGLTFSSLQTLTSSGSRPARLPASTTGTLSNREIFRLAITSRASFH